MESNFLFTQVQAPDCWGSGLEFWLGSQGEFFRKIGSDRCFSVRTEVKFSLLLRDPHSDAVYATVTFEGGLLPRDRAVWVPLLAEDPDEIFELPSHVTAPAWVQVTPEHRVLYCIQELIEDADPSDQLQALKKDNEQLKQLCIELETIVGLEQQLTHSTEEKLLNELSEKQQQEQHCAIKVKALEKQENSLRKDTKHATDIKLLYKNCKKQYNNLLQQIQLQTTAQKHTSLHTSPVLATPDTLDAQVQRELLELGYPGLLTRVEPNIYTLHNRKIYVESRDSQILCRINGEFVPLCQCVS